ncbi:MAG: alpha/beta hydrolase [Deltaproteobacteria bacterium]|nr:alpha/beta hydrolase [Deltaproteobacteria bacterium]
METKQIEANGVRFTYLEQGTGPLALMIHGFPDTAHTWDRTMPAVAAAGFRAVAPFTRGYHPTSVPGDGAYDTDTLGRDALALIDALGGGQPAIVIGHDFGAGAAYAAAALAPEKVRLLVTVAIPHPRSVKPTPKMLWTLRHFATLRTKRAPAKLRRDDFAMVDALVARWSPAWKVPPGETDRVKEAFREPGCVEAALSYYRAIGVRLPPSNKLPITVPSVAFAGEHDMIAPRAYEKARHIFTSSYEVVQVPGGHFMHREHPDVFNAELVRVLGDKGRA